MLYVRIMLDSKSMLSDTGSKCWLHPNQASQPCYAYPALHSDHNGQCLQQRIIIFPSFAMQCS